MKDDGIRRQFRTDHPLAGGTALPEGGSQAFLLLEKDDGDIKVATAVRGGTSIDHRFLRCPHPLYDRRWLLIPLSLQPSDVNLL